MGDGGVGKTSLACRYLGRPFVHDYIPTLGTDFVTKKTQIIKDSKKIDIMYHIWDLAGQPSFSQIRSLYYRGAIAGVLIFDLTRLKTLFSLKKWLEELCNYSMCKKLLISVVGNKSDLISSSKKNYFDEKVRTFIDEQLRSNSIPEGYHINYIESSAKTGAKVEEIFYHLGEDIFEYYNYLNK